MRLIDADELLNEFDRLDLDYGAMGGVAECIDITEQAPTIEPTDNEINEAYFQGYKNGKSDERQFVERHTKAEPSRPRSDVVHKPDYSYEADMVRRLKDALSADRPKGEWTEKEVTADEDTDITEWQSARCSVCGKYHTTPYMYHFDNFNFCPHCGADMRKDQDR